MMNLKQLSNKLNVSADTIIAASKALFDSVPKEFDVESIKKIEEFLTQPKQLTAAPTTPPPAENQGTLANSSNSGGTIAKQNAENLILMQQQKQQEMEAKELQAIKLAAEYKARALKQIQYDAFVKESLNEEVNFMNTLINGHINAAIRYGSIANHAADINNIEMAEIIDPLAVLKAANDKAKALPPSKEELMKLLPPSDDELKRLLDTM